MSEELPKGWVRVPLSEVAEVRLGRQRSPDRAKGEHMRPYMRAANVTWEGISLKDVKEMDFSPKEFGTYELRDGDILLSEASGSAMEVGKPALWRGQLEGCCFQNTLIRVRSRGPLPEYLHLHFLADARLGKFAAAGKGVGINHLGADRMSSWPTALPPLNEQRRIVAKLEALQARSRRAREALDAVPPLLEKLRQSILAAAFRGDLTKDWRAKNKDVEPATKLLERIRVERRKKWEVAELAKMRAKGKAPKDDKWKAKYKEPAPVDTEGLPGLPEGWCWLRLGDLGEDPLNAVQTGPFGAMLHNTEFVPDGVPVIAVGNLTGLGFRREGLYFVTAEKARELERFDVQAGDVLFARSGATTGKVCVAPAFVRDWRMTGHILRLRLDTSALKPEVAVFALAGAPAVKAQITGNIRGATRPGYNTSLLESIWVPVPPLDEQDVLVERVRSVLAVVDARRDAVEELDGHLSAMDRAVLAKAFRGELVPQDPNDEPAATMLTRAVDANGTAASSNAGAGHPSRGRGRRAGPAASKAESDAEA